MAVSINWWAFFWVSSEYEPYHLGSMINSWIIVL